MQSSDSPNDLVCSLVAMAALVSVISNLECEDSECVSYLCVNPHLILSIRNSGTSQRLTSECLCKRRL